MLNLKTQLFLIFSFSFKVNKLHIARRDSSPNQDFVHIYVHGKRLRLRM